MQLDRREVIEERISNGKHWRIETKPENGIKKLKSVCVCVFTK